MRIHWSMMLAILLAISMVAPSWAQRGRGNGISGRNKDSAKLNQLAPSLNRRTFKGESVSNGLVMRSEDRVSEISAPRSWSKQTGLNDQADLQIGDPDQGMYLIVLSESKGDFDRDMTIAEHSDLTRPNITNALQKAKETGPRQLTVNGRPAVQYELRGEISGLDIIYFHTTIEGRNHFHQILSWTLADQIQKNGQVMANVLAGFRESGDAPVPQAPPVNPVAQGVLRSDDGLTQISLPDGWSVASNLNDQADIQAANEGQNLYFISMTEPKSDYASDFTIDQHSELTRGSIDESVKNPRTTGPRRIQVQGRNAVQYEIRGTVDDFRVVYLHTTIEGTNHFHQVVMWTVPSQFNKNKAVMDQMIAGFHETGNANSAPAPNQNVAGGDVLRSDNNVCQITLPKGWTRQTGLNDQAQLQVGDLTAEAYLLVISESKEDFDAGMTAQRHSDITRQLIIDALNTPQVTGPKQIQVGGRSAVQYEIQGDLDGLKVVYLHTTVNGPTHFHQVLAWTIPRNLNQNRKALGEVLASFREIGSDNTPPRPLNGTVLRSDDGVSEITLPKGWTKQSDLNDSADLQAGHLDDEAFLIILTESKTDFDPGFTVQQHSDITRKTIVDALTSPRVTGPTKMTVGGRAALQYQINGSIDALNVVYFHTTVEGVDHFHQILSWTLPGSLEKNRTVLDQVLKSFREVNQKRADVPPPDANNNAGPIFRSTDGVSLVRLPTGWGRQEDLNDEAELEVGDSNADAYLIVLTENKADLDAGMTINEHSQITRDLLTDDLADVRTGTAKQFKIGGLSALQFNIRANFNGLNVIYLHTTIESTNHFHQVLTWTTEEQLDRNLPAMNAVLHSFREANAKTSTINSSDGTSQVDVPDGWVKMDGLNDQAHLEVGNQSDDVYLIVISENQSELDGMSISDHSQLTRSTLTASLQQVRTGRGQRITVGGRPALQFEIRAKFEGLDIVYLHTTIQGRTHMHQVLSWTTEDRFNSNRRQMDTVIHSFRESQLILHEIPDVL